MLASERIGCNTRTHMYAQIYVHTCPHLKHEHKDAIVSCRSGLRTRYKPRKASLVLRTGLCNSYFQSALYSASRSLYVYVYAHTWIALRKVDFNSANELSVFAAAATVQDTEFTPAPRTNTKHNNCTTLKIHDTLRRKPLTQGVRTWSRLQTS